MAFSYILNFFPSTTITFMSGTGYRNSLSFLAILMLRKLWVLPVSINTVTLSFLICPFNLRVCGWLMHVMVASDILGVLSPTRSGVTFWGFSTSLTDSFESDSSSFSASHVYNFLSYLLYDTCLGSQFSLYICFLLFFASKRLHLPSFILWASKLLFYYSLGFLTIVIGK
jgi:hypothetical protein